MWIIFCASVSVCLDSRWRFFKSYFCEKEKMLLFVQTEFWWFWMKNNHTHKAFLFHVMGCACGASTWARIVNNVPVILMMTSWTVRKRTNKGIIDLIGACICATFLSCTYLYAVSQWIKRREHLFFTHQWTMIVLFAIITVKWFYRGEVKA